jgi:integrase
VGGIAGGINFPELKKDKKMPTLIRYKTKYPEVFYIMGKATGTGKPEKIYYIRYRKDGRRIEEKAGRQYQDDMTPARAAGLRAEKIEGKRPSNKEKRAAEEAAKQAEAKKWTVDRLFNEYKKGRRKNKGLKIDEGRYDNYLKTVFGDKEPKDIIALDVDRLRIKLLKKKSPQTVAHILNLFTWIVNFGIKRNLCQGLSFHVQKPEVNNEKTEDLTPGQLAKLLKTIDKDTNIQAANIMKLALFTGMRRGEMFKLKWKDINFDRDFISIKDPKGGPDQKIPLNDAAKDLFKSHPRSKSPYVFPGRGGRQRTDIKHQVNRIKEDAGLPKDFRALHGLRHVYASMLASSGEVGMYTLQKLLTHKDPKMTQRYAHLRDEALKQASEVAGNIILAASKKKVDKKVVNLEDRQT